VFIRRNEFRTHLAVLEAQRTSCRERLVETIAWWADQLDRRGSGKAVEELRKTLDCLQEQVDILERVLASVKPGSTGS